MGKKEIIGVALTKELCLICAEANDAEIIMNTELTPFMADKVKELHGKVTKWAEKPCKTCQENLDKSFLFIGFDESKSDLNNLPEGFYRTGHIVGVKKNIPLVQEFVKEHEPNALKKGFIFIPLEAMKKFGLVK